MKFIQLLVTLMIGLGMIALAIVFGSINKRLDALEQRVTNNLPPFIQTESTSWDSNGNVSTTGPEAYKAWLQRTERTNK